METVVKAGYIEELKHLSRLQPAMASRCYASWAPFSQPRTDYHGSAISAENSSRLLTFSRRQTRGSLRDILQISWGRGSRYKEIEEDKEECRGWKEVDIAAEERMQARVVGRQCCRCYPPRPARAAPARKLRVLKSLFRDLRRRQSWKPNLEGISKSQIISAQKPEAFWLLLISRVSSRVDDTLDINSTKIAWSLCTTQYRLFNPRPVRAFLTTWTVRGVRPPWRSAPDGRRASQKKNSRCASTRSRDCTYCF